MAALLATILSLAVFVFTAAPSVTLLDSGEFIVAAQGFGVPHPTGYPLWTLLGWLFTLLPVGNAAWEVTLLSGIFGALATGVTALLIRSSTAWLHPELATNAPRLTTALSVSSALTVAFSLSFWTQATIAEVYTLHALLISLYLLSLYAWLRRPGSDSLIYTCFFTLSLAFGNHQLALSLAPLPFLIVAFLRRDLIWDLLVAAAVSVLIAYLTFALFTDNPVVIKAAVRLCFLVVTVVAIACVIRRFQLRWKLIAFLPLAILVGLLPYAYLPIASATNPPMNWGYTQTADGFFASFNRSQYRGTLSDQSLRILAKVVGVSDLAPTKPGTPIGVDTPSTTERLRTWGGFFWGKLLTSFTPISLIFLFGALWAAIRATAAQRTWILVLATAFVLAAFLQPVLDGARIDRSGWWLQMPYHAHTNLIYGVLTGIGLLHLIALIPRNSQLSTLNWIFTLLPLWPLIANYSTASQRGNWLGYDYGHEMLADLPPNSVIFGGTDPGRFIPTYLILGESPQRPGVKRDPDFDRRDLTILTQNALADRHYLAYVRDHYAPSRPAPRNAFDRWLGRGTAYPGKPLTLPTLSELRETTRIATEEGQARSPQPSPVELAEDAVASVSQWIFERNKDDRTFYVEESFPLRWSYPHAVPEGLVYRLDPEPLDELPADIIANDREFWTDKTAALLADPHYRRDFDAQRAYSELRVTGGHLYEFRNLPDEAEFAFRQALELFPTNLDALRGLTRILWARGDYAGPIAHFDTAIPLDPHNDILTDLRATALERYEAQQEIAAAESKLAADPDSLPTLENLVALLSRVGQSDQVTAILEKSDSTFGNDPAYLAFGVRVAEARNDWASSARYGSQLVAVAPQDAEAHYRLARARYALGEKEAALASLRNTANLNPALIQQNLTRDPVFQDATQDPTLAPLFQKN